MTEAMLENYVRENPVPGLGRGCLLVGALMVFSAAASLAARAVVEAQAVEGAAKPAWPSTFISFAYQHHRVLALAQASIGLAVGLVGVLALRPRPRARALIEALSWAALASTLVLGPLFIYSWRQAPAPLVIFVLIAGSLVTVRGAVKLISLIKFLRSPSVRTSFQSS
jgi:hypothetical protein